MKLKYDRKTPTPLVGEDKDSFEQRAKAKADRLFKSLSRTDFGAPEDTFSTDARTYGAEYARNDKKVRFLLDADLNIVVEVEQGDELLGEQKIETFDDLYEVAEQLIEFLNSAAAESLDDSDISHNEAVPEDAHVPSLVPPVSNESASNEPEPEPVPEVEFSFEVKHDFWALAEKCGKRSEITYLPWALKNNAMALFGVLRQSRLGTPQSVGVSMQTDPIVIRFEHDLPYAAIIWESAEGPGAHEAYVLNRVTQERFAVAYSATPQDLLEGVLDRLPPPEKTVSSVPDRQGQVTQGQTALEFDREAAVETVVPPAIDTSATMPSPAHERAAESPDHSDSASTADIETVAGDPEHPDSQPSAEAAVGLDHTDKKPAAESPDHSDTVDVIEEEPEPTTLEGWFDLYRDADDYVKLAEEAVEDTRQNLNDVTKRMFKALGPGPFKYGDRHVRLIERGNTYFLRNVKEK